MFYNDSIGTIYLGDMSTRLVQKLWGSSLVYLTNTQLKYLPANNRICPEQHADIGSAKDLPISDYSYSISNTLYDTS